MRGFLIDRPLRSRGTSMGLSMEVPGRSVCWAQRYTEAIAPRTKPAKIKVMRFPIACSAKAGTIKRSETWPAAPRALHPTLTHAEGERNMVERKIELKR